MKEILDFINRRFPTDSNWLSGNCYYFAKILQLRFGGELYYDLVDGHFLLMLNGRFYDWSGYRSEYNVESSSRDFNYVIKWNEYEKIDPLHYERIVRDVIM